ncbi:MAG: hypothetical protein JJU21_07680 [Salinarimonas sp.]|nr:hypothetical protein [Salinarimonas sp.]
MSSSALPAFHSTTIKDALMRLFPFGTRTIQGQIDKFPLIPSDLFAGAAFLIEHGDLYRRIAPEGPQSNATGVRFSLTPEERRSCETIGEEWIKTFREENFKLLNAQAIQAYWDVLIKHQAEPLRPGEKLSDASVEICHAAMALLVISDRACHEIGFRSREPDWFSLFTRGETLNHQSTIEDEINNDRWHVRNRAFNDTICIVADQQVARVLPKSRTPAVGCTMRTLTENLALLPPSGGVNMHWFHPVGDPKHDGNALNVLAIPYPYRIAASDFKPGNRNIAEPDGSWNWFALTQSWLPTNKKAVAQFVLELIREAEKDCGTVHGVVFPEYALNWETYSELVQHIRTDAPGVEFIVAGSSGDEEGAKGNFVLTTTFEEAKQERKALTYSRAKHHRWRLDKAQIKEYGLASALDPHVLWWEDIAIEPRKVGLTAFRKRSIFSTLICEDLARSEPCHSAVRSVGPNLVFVLLMDGPQIANRWSARYATSLADDPGCAVLTLTCKGLIQRVNTMGRRPQNNAVALWKDDVNSVSSLDLPNGAAALLLTLSAESTREATLDGRKTAAAAAWRYHSHVPIFPNEKAKQALSGNAP